MTNTFAASTGPFVSARTPTRSFREVCLVVLAHCTRCPSVIRLQQEVCHTPINSEHQYHRSDGIARHRIIVKSSHWHSDSRRIPNTPSTFVLDRSPTTAASGEGILRFRRTSSYTSKGHCKTNPERICHSDRQDESSPEEQDRHQRMHQHAVRHVLSLTSSSRCPQTSNVSSACTASCQTRKTSFRTSSR